MISKILCRANTSWSAIGLNRHKYLLRLLICPLETSSLYFISHVQNYSLLLLKTVQSSTICFKKGKEKYLFKNQFVSLEKWINKETLDKEKSP